MARINVRHNFLQRQQEPMQLNENSPTTSIDEDFSGQHPFIEGVFPDDRNYFNVGIVLKRHVVHVLQSMNTSPEYQGANGDRAFVNALLDRVFTKNELAEGSAFGNYSHGIAHAALCSRRLDFIYGNFFFQFCVLSSLKWLDVFLLSNIQDLLRVRVHTSPDAKERLSTFVNIVNKKCSNARR